MRKIDRLIYAVFAHVGLALAEGIDNELHKYLPRQIGGGVLIWPSPTSATKMLDTDQSAA